MPQQFSRHLWSVVILVASVAVALVADHLAATPVRPRPATSGLVPDIGGQINRVALDSALPRTQIVISADPFAPAADQSDVAPGATASTVPSSTPSRPRLTAILIADERRVAVIDETTVSVGDMLSDGARVSAIQPDRVWIVGRDGRWRMLTLTNRGTR